MDPDNDDPTIKPDEAALIVGADGEMRLSVADRAARQGRNPRTGEPLQSAASKQPRFKPGKALKEAVNG